MRSAARLKMGYSESGTIRNRRMEAVFLEHTYKWLRMDGVLILVIPFERLHDCTGILSSHFTGLKVFRMTDPDSVQYRQIAIFGLRHEVRGAAVENNKRQLQNVGLYGTFEGLLLSEMRRMGRKEWRRRFTGLSSSPAKTKASWAISGSTLISKRSPVRISEG